MADGYNTTPSEGYTPIETKADRREAMLDGLIDGTKQFVKTVAYETYEHIADKVIPQGADEVANVLYTGSAYLPWPGQGKAPDRTPDEVGVHGPATSPVQIEAPTQGGDLAAYMSGDYSSPQIDHNSLYGGSGSSGGVHGPAVEAPSASLGAYLSGNYDSRLDALAARPQPQRETQLEY
jgi:hypothetical protein